MSAATTRPWGRMAAAVLMPTGPAAVAVLRFLLPYNTNDSSAVMVAKMAAEPARERIVVWLFVVALLTLAPGAIAAIRLVAPNAPRLAGFTTALMVPGYLAIAGVGLVDFVGFRVNSANQGAITAVVTQLNSSAPVNVLTVIFVVGHLSGTVLLGITLFRAHVLTLVPAVVLAVSQPLHLAAALTGNHLVDLVGWGMTAVGMAFVARAAWRTSPKSGPDHMSSEATTRAMSNFPG